MTNAAGLDANAHLSFTRRSDGPLYEVKSPGFRYFDRPIRFSHLRLLRPRGHTLPRCSSPVPPLRTWYHQPAHQRPQTGCHFIKRTSDVHLNPNAQEWFLCGGYLSCHRSTSLPLLAHARTAAANFATDI